MVQKSGDHQLRDRLFIPLFTGFYNIPGGAGFQPSTVTSQDQAVYFFKHLKNMGGESLWNEYNKNLKKWL